jgi:hypothetical protein
MNERRYSDEEVAAIFARATEGTSASPVGEPQQEGLTLAELQEIGAEVGIAPSAVAAAAKSLVPAAAPEGRTFLGLPVSVGRTVNFDRKLTEDEWEQLVVELREVFNARGTMSGSGGFRQWTNGNLQALLEPTPTGQRLRLRTTNGQFRRMLGAGTAALGLAGVIAVSSAGAGGIASALPGVATALAASAFLFANSALRLPKWARRRREQMDAIAARLAERV